MGSGAHVHGRVLYYCFMGVVLYHKIVTDSTNSHQLCLVIFAHTPVNIDIALLAACEVLFTNTSVRNFVSLFATVLAALR